MLPQYLFLIDVSVLFRFFMKCSTSERYALAAMLTTHNSPIVAIDFSTDGRYVRSTCQVIPPLRHCRGFGSRKRARNQLKYCRCVRKCFSRKGPAVPHACVHVIRTPYALPALGVRTFFSRGGHRDGNSGCIQAEERRMGHADGTL